jgi:hypothetical protein
MRRWHALALVALLVLAGCSEVIGTEPAGRTPTVTPAPIPATDAPSAALAPGLNATGVTDPLALANAHSAALGGRSYTLDSTWTVRHANGSLRAFIDLHAHVDEPTFQTQVRVDGTETGFVSNRPTTAVFWSDGRELVERVERDNRITYLHVPAAEYNNGSGFYNSLKRPTPWRDTYGLLAALDLRVVDAQHEGDTTVYLLEGDHLDDAALFAATTNTDRPENVTFRAVVNERGFILRYRLTYTATVDGEPVRVTRVVRYRNLGETIVSKPGWYATAKNESVRDAALAG